MVVQSLFYLCIVVFLFLVDCVYLNCHVHFLCITRAACFFCRRKSVSDESAPVSFYSELIVTAKPFQNESA